MGSINRDLFRAIHEGKWLSVEYKNGKDEITRYWIGVKNVDPKQRKLLVSGMHLVSMKTADLTVFIDAIQSSCVIDGSLFPTNSALLRDIDANPDRYASIFGSVPNLRVLDYYEDCCKLDAKPYTKDFALIKKVDADRFRADRIALDENQFRQIVAFLRKESENKASARKSYGSRLNQLALNMMSIRTKKGLFVFAYRRLCLDIETRALVMADSTTLCHEFRLSGGKAKETVSLRRYLDEEYRYPLSDFDTNREAIKDVVMDNCRLGELVDDEPYLVLISREQVINLHVEYEAICEMYEEGSPTIPIRAFFGELTKRPQRRKNYPIVLMDNKANLDQLLAINKAIKYPLAYIQGPPGTGKTTTIVNTIVTAFFNGRSVLFASHNNHPVDGVCESLSHLKHRGHDIPIPLIRLGNLAVTARALDNMGKLYGMVKDLDVYESTLDKNKDEQSERTEELVSLLQGYEEMLDLRERRECIEKMLETNDNLTFGMDLGGRQLNHLDDRIRKIEATEGTLDRALSLVGVDTKALAKYLYYVSVKFVKRLGEPKNADFMEVVMSNDDPDDRARRFNKIIADSGSLKRLLRIFPLVATTCISAHRLGKPEPLFGMTIIDEASQCTAATALIPVLRGQSLMLVGDPQQLNPVILLDQADNEELKKSYGIPDEYDYAKQSVYKVFLGCDAVSDEILLSHHYRCDEQIIEFNNKKYYRGRLKVESGRRASDALTYYDVKENVSTIKNTAPAEADAIVRYAAHNKDKTIGVITPFVNQRDYLQMTMQEYGLKNVTCGTVHAFQGDEQDVVLLSLALTDRTTQGTYSWLADNRELINVATSRAKDRLVVLSSQKELDRLHAGVKETDDIYELIEFVKSKGKTEVTQRKTSSRALGIKPYSTKTESAFLENLNHALDNVFVSNTRHVVRREVPISHVFQENAANEFLFYSGKFDFVVYETGVGREEVPVLAIELDGKEHHESDVVQERDRQKNEICKRHGFELIRVENSYARRYNYIKEILADYFKVV